MKMRVWPVSEYAKDRSGCCIDDRIIKLFANHSDAVNYINGRAKNCKIMVKTVECSGDGWYYCEFVDEMGITHILQISGYPMYVE